jgi:hypothetical protein
MYIFFSYHAIDMYIHTIIILIIIILKKFIDFYIDSITLLPSLIKYHFPLESVRKFPPCRNNA